MAWSEVSDLESGRRTCEGTRLDDNERAMLTEVHEAWFVDRDGFVTEGTSTNAWIVTAEAAIVTRQADELILHGVARATLFDVARALRLRVEERPFTPQEAQRTREAFLSSATTIATPVVSIDGKAAGEGRPGATVAALRRAFHEIAEKS